MVRNRAPGLAVLVQAALRSSAAHTRMAGLGGAQFFTILTFFLENNIVIYGMWKLYPDHKKIFWWSHPNI